MATGAPNTPQLGTKSNATEKVIMITGGTSGIGKAIFETIVLHNPTHVYMLCRNMTKGMAIIEKMQRVAPNVLMSFLSCDLSSFDSIRRAVSDFSFLTNRLDVLICNAGTFFARPSLTDEGFERHFGVNLVGHTLLIKLLLPTLLQTSAQPPGDVRIIFIGSRAHMWAPPNFIDFDGLRTAQDSLTSKQRYGQSKLAIILYAKELAKRYPALKVLTVDPGCVDTNIAHHLKKKYLHSDRLIRFVFPILKSVYRKFGGVLLTPEQGAKLPIWCATAPTDVLLSGEYYDSIGVAVDTSKLAGNLVLSLDLWDWVQDIVTSIPFEENTTNATNPIDK